jgi:superkiller protein 3
MFPVAQAWREASLAYRAAFAAGGLALASLFLLGLAYPVVAWQRPPGLSQEPLLWARRFLGEGRLALSIREYEAGALVNPGDPHGLAEWGRALGQSGDVKGEVEACLRALQLRPQDPGLQAQAATAFFRAGRNEEAIAAWSRVLGRAPRDFRAWAGLGDVWLEIDRYPEAVAAFTRSLQIQPDNAAARNSLGIALSLQGRPDEAVEQFRLAVRLLPSPEFTANLRKAEGEQARARPREGR